MLGMCLLAEGTESTDSTHPAKPPPVGHGTRPESHQTRYPMAE